MFGVNIFYRVLGRQTLTLQKKLRRINENETTACVRYENIKQHLQKYFITQGGRREGVRGETQPLLRSTESCLIIRCSLHNYIKKVKKLDQLFRLMHECLKYTSLCYIEATYNNNVTHAYNDDRLSKIHR